MAGPFEDDADSAAALRCARETQRAGERVRERRAARALVLSQPDNLILLLRFRSPVAGADMWLLPGGGAHPGEDECETLRREVWEETGLRIAASETPLIWRREHTYSHDAPHDAVGGRTRQAEGIYLVRTRRFVPTAANNPEADEAGIFREFRWWSVGAIRASGERFVPSGLADRVARLVVNGPPMAPEHLEA